jgi:hypothetical protein
MKKALVIFILSVVWCNSNAQLVESDTLPWQYELAATFFITKGNVDRSLAKTDVAMRHVEQSWGFASTNTHLYGSFKGVATERDLLSKNFFYLSPKRRFYPYLMGWFETNLRRKIDFRYQVGPGASYVVLRKALNIIRISSTLTYEHTNFKGNIFENAPDQTREIFQTWRLTGRLYGEHFIASNKLILQYELWYQPSLEDDNNYRYHADGALKAPIVKKLSLKLSLNYTYENVVLEGVKNRDLYWTIGFSFTN